MNFGFGLGLLWLYNLMHWTSHDLSNPELVANAGQLWAYRLKNPITWKDYDNELLNENEVALFSISKQHRRSKVRGYKTYIATKHRTFGYYSFNQTRYATYTELMESLNNSS